MAKTTLLFLDTALEIVPREIQHHEIIKNNAKRRNKQPSNIILDSSYHFKAMMNLKESKRRGRPDIIHFCLLNLLGSLLNLNNEVEIYIHTFNDTIISVNQNVRLPRNYNRFIGLMEQLFKKKKIKSNNLVLLNILEKTKVNDIIENIPLEKRILLTRKGSYVNILEYFRARRNDDLLIAIGAFPHGDFNSEFQNKFTSKISLSEHSLDAWIALNEILISRNHTLKEK